MAQYQSSFQDADYGCGSPSEIAAEFNLEPVSISHVDTDPAIARVKFNFTNKLTLSNVKYSTTTDQDVSAWLVLSSAVESLISSDKTFVPREDCTTTTNELAGEVEIAIKKDTSVKVGGRWSGFDDEPDGLALPSIERVDFPLSDDFTITPPQNLQVTFPTQPDGEINASIDAWSKNSNIGGVPVPGGEQWNWRVELLGKNGDVVSVKDFNIGSLTPTLSVDTSKVEPDQEYRIRVTVMNEYEASVSVTSPEVYSLPLAPIFRRGQFLPQEDGALTLRIDFAKPRSSGVLPETLSVNDQTVVVIENGASWVGSTEITGIEYGQSVYVLLKNTTIAGSNSVAQTFRAPMHTPELSVAWDDVKRCARISATVDEGVTYNLRAGYSVGDTSLGAVSNQILEVCDLEHAGGQILYAEVLPSVDGVQARESMAYATFEIPNPIIGVTKTCDNEQYIVDIVENKQGEVTERWQTGDRVKVVDPC